jgi:hypothetical protein
MVSRVMTVQSLDPEGAVHLADFLVILLRKKDIAGKPSGGTGRLDFTRSIRSHQFSTLPPGILRASVRRHRSAQGGSTTLRSIRPKRASGTSGISCRAAWRNDKARNTVMPAQSTALVRSAKTILDVRSIRPSILKLLASVPQSQIATVTTSPSGETSAGKGQKLRPIHAGNGANVSVSRYFPHFRGSWVAG